MTMSALSDYSKFDNLDSDDSDDGNRCGDVNSSPASSENRTRSAAATAAPVAVPAAAAAPAVGRGVTKKSSTADGRYVFEYAGQKVYEWEQSLEEVTVYVDAPPGVTASVLEVNILPGRLQVGMRGTDRYFIDEATFDKVKPDESSWYLDKDGEGGSIITITMAKCFRGQTWEGVLRGAAVASSSGIEESVDPVTKQEMQQTMMLERFQEENPGFDFRDATFNGEAPDPRTFMGGVGYDR